MTSGEKITAVILAGGTGERMGGDIPKQFLSLGGKPVIMHSVEAFEEHPVVTDIVIVCCATHMNMMSRFRRTRKPISPITKSAALRNRKWLVVSSAMMPSFSLFACA